MFPLIGDGLFAKVPPPEIGSDGLSKVAAGSQAFLTLAFLLFMQLSVQSDPFCL